jgi:hypothetical protein
MCYTDYYYTYDDDTADATSHAVVYEEMTKEKCASIAGGASSAEIAHIMNYLFPHLPEGDPDIRCETPNWPRKKIPVLGDEYAVTFIGDLQTTHNANWPNGCVFDATHKLYWNEGGIDGSTQDGSAAHLCSRVP